jgi:protocatechuate 3,4-dioxygenase beta subunit
MPEPVVVELGDGADVEGVRLVMPATGRLHGIVRDEAGSAVPGVSVSAALTDAWSSPAVQTNDDGRFAFEHLRAGTYRITVQLGWLDPLRAPETTDDDVQGEVVEVAEGQTAEVELVVERRSGIIRGRVLDSDGGPVRDAFVDASRMSDSAASNTTQSRMWMQWGWDRKPVLTDHDGSFELRELAHGDYLVRAYREGGGEALLEGVAVGTSDAVLTIVETGRIAGKVITVAGDSPTRFSVNATDRNGGLSRSDRFFRTDGAFSLSDLPPGKYELRTSAGEGSAKLDVELAPGEVIDDLVIELVGNVTVKGRLIDAETGTPVPGLRVSVVEQRGMYIFSDSDVGDRRDVSDADGRFEVDDAPTGKVVLTVVPRDPRDPGKFGWTQRSIHLSSDPTVQDLGDIELLASRLDEQQRAGDTGFKSKPNAPDVEPENIVFEVAVIRPGGPAEAGGLAIGDRIVEIDGLEVSGLDSHRYHKLIAAPSGTVIALTLEGGKAVSIKLGPPLDW